MLTVRTNVGSRSPVFQVAVALSTDMSRNTDRSATVGDTRAEGTNVASLMTASETEIIVLAVDGDVLVVTLAQLLDRRLNVLHSSGLTHSLGGVVGVASGAVPVTLERLGVEGDLDAPRLGNADEQIARHPEVVTHGDTLARADLELPLRGHDLSVDTGDVHAGVEAGAIVGLNEVTSEYFAGT